jgi:hypothetical protein
VLRRSPPEPDRCPSPPLCANWKIKIGDDDDLYFVPGLGRAFSVSAREGMTEMSFARCWMTLNNADPSSTAFRSTLVAHVDQLSLWLAVNAYLTCERVRSIDLAQSRMPM